MIAAPFLLCAAFAAAACPGNGAISFETASGLRVTGEVAYPCGTWNGRLWVVDGADAATREGLLKGGAAVAARSSRLEAGAAPSADRWRDVGFRAVQGFVAAARREVAARFGRADFRTYYLGVGAAGGNAALHAAQQFPESIDGALAFDAALAPAAGRAEGVYVNAANPDLHAFRRGGGKLLVRAVRGTPAFAHLAAYRDRVFEMAGSALRGGRYFAFAGVASASAEAQLAAAATLAAWRERDVTPPENAGFDDTPAPATCTANRYDFATLTLAAAHDGAPGCTDPFDYIRDQLARGARDIHVPTARYEVAPKDRTDGGDLLYLKLRGLSDVTIDFGHAEVIGRVRTRMLDCAACTNLTLRNLTVDFRDLPFTQGVITKVDGERSWEVKILEGYPNEGITGKKGESASHDDFWPLQAYDARTLDWVNPMRFQDGIAIVRTGADTFRVTGGENRTGDVGDIAVWSVKDRANRTVGETFIFHGSPGLRCEDITLFSTPHGRAFFEFFGDASVFSGCRIVRRPPETDLRRRAMRRLRSGNHDGIISKACARGPRIEDCQFTHHCDDCVNISGQYSVFYSRTGRTWRVLDNWLGVKIEPGSTLQMLTFDGRTLTNVVRVLSVTPAGPVTPEESAFMQDEAGLVFGLGKAVKRASHVVVDGDLDPGKGAAILSANRMGAGFSITNCVFGHARARGLLLKASHGEVRDSLIVRTAGPGVSVSTEYSWLSGGCASDLTIAGNTFCHAGRWQISVGGDVGVNRPVKAELQAGAHADIRIWNNRLSGVRGILLVGCSDVSIRDNAMAVEETKREARLFTVRCARIRAD